MMPRGEFRRGISVTIQVAFQVTAQKHEPLSSGLRIDSGAGYVRNDREENGKLPAN